MAEEQERASGHVLLHPGGIPKNIEEDTLSRDIVSPKPQNWYI